MKHGFITAIRNPNKNRCQWIKLGEPPPKKFKTQPSAGQVLATIFWYAEGILAIDCMPTKTTITGN